MHIAPSKILSFFILALSVYITGCGTATESKKEKRYLKRDTTITPRNAYSELFMDSMTIEKHIEKLQPADSTVARNLRGFYNSRNYQFAWFTKNTLNEQGVSFWNLLNSYIGLSKDSSLYNKALAEKMDLFLDDTAAKVSAAELAGTDIALTQLFFNYAQTAYAGRMEPSDLQWFIPRKKVDALALLDTMISRKGSAIEMWEPLSPLYQNLKKKLVQYNTIAEKGGWDSLKIESKQSLKPGDISPLVPSLRKRLYVAGNIDAEDSSSVYDSTLADAVKKVQLSFGFKGNGIVDKKLADVLNVPVKQRIEQMLINLERMRWLPEKSVANRIVVNIPEFVIHVYEQDKKVLDMNIVVGKQGSSTVIFNNELKYIVFSPYWNVPRSIVRNEIVPAMKRNPSYLSRHNMESTGTSGGLPVIRQKPGGRNSLGLVKFLFPNNYNIYFHDTPSKSLFDREKRAFSHGCIRLADAEKMANYLLKDYPEWTPEKIKEAMHQSKEKWVTLKQPIPVYISYFTTWVDEDGILNFRDDIYGHDAKMAKQLFLYKDSAQAL